MSGVLVGGGRMLYWGCRRGLSWRSVLAAGEYIVELGLRQGVGHVVACGGSGEALIYGLYLGVDSSVDEDVVERRITGGKAVGVGDGWCYVGVAVPARSLLDSVSLAVSLSSCLGAAGWGATLFGETGFVELFVPSGCPGPGDLGECLGARLARAGVLGPGVLGRYAALFSSREWRLYRYRRGAAEAILRAGDFFLRLSVDVVDGYIVDWWLSSNAYMAPPMEVFSILASVKGAPFHELTLSNLETAIGARLEVYGIGKRDLVEALKRLYRAVGVSHYGVEV